jgi:hypothetical protein
MPPGRSRSAGDVHLPQRRAFGLRRRDWPASRVMATATTSSKVSRATRTPTGQRGKIGGWRHAGLPWHQGLSFPAHIDFRDHHANVPHRLQASSTRFPDADCQERIRAARARSAGSRHPLPPLSACRRLSARRPDRRFAQAGERLAAQTDAEYIVFCGVHFMAEVADIMSAPEQIAILPDLAAGCSMADMANLAKVERCWRELGEVLAAESASHAGHLHQLGRRPEGLLRRTWRHRVYVVQRRHHRRMGVRAAPKRSCSSRPAPRALDRHKMGIPLDEMVVWDPDLNWAA